MGRRKKTEMAEPGVSTPTGEHPVITEILKATLEAQDPLIGLPVPKDLLSEFLFTLLPNESLDLFLSPSLDERSLFLSSVLRVGLSLELLLSEFFLKSSKIFPDLLPLDLFSPSFPLLLFGFIFNTN